MLFYYQKSAWPNQKRNINYFTDREVVYPLLLRIGGVVIFSHVDTNITTELGES